MFERPQEQPERTLSEQDYYVPDERLRLIFICCHPALNKKAQVALTLRTLCGITVKEIARAYLTSDSSSNQYLACTSKDLAHHRLAAKAELEIQLGQKRAAFLFYNR